MLRLRLAAVVIAAAGAAVFATQAQAADAAAGEKVFKANCAICHTTEAGKNKIGPSLFGLIGRHTGSIEGFKYSAANKSANIVWEPEILDKYIENPKAVVPGTIMPYAGLKDATQRADLIAFLATQK